MGVVVVGVLCLGVFAQMLGVSTTLTSASDELDLLSVSVLDGWSIPAVAYCLDVPTIQHSASGVLAVPHVPVLAFVPFHPPLV